MGTIGKGERRDSDRRKPPAVVLARAAAYVDSEGSIAIARSTQVQSPNPAFFLHIVVDNTDPRLPYWFLGQFGGRVYGYPPHGKRKIRWWRWQANAAQRREFLHWIRPFMLLKREQIDVALAFLVLQAHAKHPGPKPREQHYIGRLTECFEQLRELRTERFYRSVHPQRLNEAAPQ